MNGRGNVISERNGQWLRVVRAGSHNAGVYTCSAANPAGLLDVDLSLTVLGKYLSGTLVSCWARRGGKIEDFYEKLNITNTFTT